MRSPYVPRVQACTVLVLVVLLIVAVHRLLSFSSLRAGCVTCQLTKAVAQRLSPAWACSMRIFAYARAKGSQGMRFAHVLGVVGPLGRRGWLGLWHGFRVRL